MSGSAVGAPGPGEDQEPEAANAEAAEVLELEPLLEQLELPPQKTAEVRRLVTTIMSFQGPIPPPDLLRHYEEIVPGSANRLIRLTEKQTDHRIAMEGTIVKGRMGLSTRGQWMAFGLSLFFGVIALWLGLEGHDALAGAIVVTTIVGLAVVFVLGKRPGVPMPNKRSSQAKQPPDDD